jgi:hypothetical protein
MEQLFNGLFRVLDPRAVFSIVLLCFELLQEAETRRPGRVPGSTMLGHAETLLAAMRHSITEEISSTSSRPSLMRFVGTTVKNKG